MSTNAKPKNTKQNKQTVQIMNATEENKNSSLLERSEYSLELVNGWIFNADTKVSISSGVFSVTAAALVFIAENILKEIDKSYGVNNKIYGWFIAVAILAALTFLVSEFLHLWAISPSFKSGKKKEEQKNPQFSIFYDEIRNYKSAAEYVLAARKASENDFEGEVLKEVYYNSEICTNKMNRFKFAIWSGWASILLIVLSGCLYYCSYSIH